MSFRHGCVTSRSLSCKFTFSREGAAAEVNRKSTLPIPEPILQLQRQLEQFRSSRPKTDKTAAVALAGGSRASPATCGVPRRASPAAGLYAPKQRLEGPPARHRKAPKPAFVELAGPRSAALEGCVIEFESSGGGKMRIQWKVSAAPDWVSLLRAWRDAER